VNGAPAPAGWPKKEAAPVGCDLLVNGELTPESRLANAPGAIARWNVRTNAAIYE